MHVDSGLVVSNDLQILQSARQDPCRLYNVKWKDSTSEHLGIKISWDRQHLSIHLSQESYLQHVLDRSGMERSNPVKNPLHSSTRLILSSAEDIASQAAFPYREILGCLNHTAVNTRPEIAHAVSELAQFSSCYGLARVTAAKHLLCYVKGTLDIGHIFLHASLPVTLTQTMPTTSTLVGPRLNTPSLLVDLPSVGAAVVNAVLLSPPRRLSIWR